MNKTYSNKTIALIILISFFSGSVPAYASSIMNSDALTAFRSYLEARVPDYFKSVDSKTSDALNDSKTLLKEHLDNSAQTIVNNVDAYVDDEGARIEDELNAYTEELIAGVEDNMDIEEERLKEIVQSYVNYKITYTKEQLHKEINAELQKSLLEQLEAQDE